MLNGFCYVLSAAVLSLVVNVVSTSMRWRISAILAQSPTTNTQTARVLRDNTDASVAIINKCPQPIGETHKSVTIYSRDPLTAQNYVKTRHKVMQKHRCHPVANKPSNTTKLLGSKTLKSNTRFEYKRNNRLFVNTMPFTTTPVVVASKMTTVNLISNTTKTSLSSVNGRVSLPILVEWTRSWRRPPVIDIFSRSFKLNEWLAWRHWQETLTKSNDKTTATVITSTTPSTTVRTTVIITDPALKTFHTEIKLTTNTTDADINEDAANNFLSLNAFSTSSRQINSAHRQGDEYTSLQTFVTVPAKQHLLFDAEDDGKDDGAVSTADWRLYNHCSKGYATARTFDNGAGGWIHARGRTASHCLTVWRAHFWPDNSFALETLARRRRRLLLCVVGGGKSHFALRKWTRKSRQNTRCRFREHMTRTGYMLLESGGTDSVGSFLGFDRRGRALSPKKYHASIVTSPRCFRFSRVHAANSSTCRNPLQSNAADISMRVLVDGGVQNQTILRDLARDALLRRIEV